MALTFDRQSRTEPGSGERACGEGAGATFPRKRWRIPTADPQAALELARTLGTSPTIGQILLNRGFDLEDRAAAQTFLRPQLSDLIEPDRLPGLPRAAERIARALADAERIVIYGDYDVDGITATAILWHALTLLGGNPALIQTYVPHRVDEGYGLNLDAVRKLANDGAQVLISVDCGITAIDEALFAQEAGMDLIVTDHHEWRTTQNAESGGLKEDAPRLPEAFALVHPRLPGGSYPNPDLTGAGVAFKLAWEVGKQVTGRPRVSEEMRNFLVEALALAALGTIADVAPLVGENRVIARFGLGGLKQTKLRGLRALIDSAGLSGQNLDSYHVGFLLGPRLNACGRMGHAERAVHMLTRAESGEARDIAEYLEQQNRDRQQIERKIVEQAIEQVRDRGWDAPQTPAIVVDGAGWHVGVVGIVASRLVDRFHRPTVVLSCDERAQTAGGSGRSVYGFHLARALAECTDLLDGHGGHAMAAGVHLKCDHIAAFRERFTEIARRELTPEQLSPTLRADAEVTLDCVDGTLVKELARLGPFGPGNPKPLLVLRDLTVLSARSCGKNGEHLQLLLDDHGGCRIRAIAFGCGKLALELRGGDTLDLVGEPSFNEWNGRVTVELAVKDLAPKARRR